MNTFLIFLLYLILFCYLTQLSFPIVTVLSDGGMPTHSLIHLTNCKNFSVHSLIHFTSWQSILAI